nr:SAM-dependent methyltransferase [uncultured Achromobacter sp.]
MMSARGSLVVVGSGIKAGAHFSAEAKWHIRSADRVLHLVADPITQRLIEELNPQSETLLVYYKDGKSRTDSYRDMVEKIVEQTVAGHEVCVVFYGHPGVFAFPGHEAIRILRDKGHRATMLPGISAEDCLFSDLGVDPATYGCQSFEATDFVLNERIYDPRCLLVLWQIGVLGYGSFQKAGYDNSNIPVLLDYLFKLYEPGHEAIIYEASQYVICKPKTERIKLDQLKHAALTPISTLVLFPQMKTVVSIARLNKLKMCEDHLLKI